MQFTSILAVLLAAPALISAAPVAVPTDVTLISPVEVDANALFSRAGMVCKPRKGKDATDQAKVDAALDRMRKATQYAHEATDSCPGESAFRSAATKAKKEEIKKKCVDGFTKCVQQRKKANKECQNAGGTVDQGHMTAITVCESSKTSWSNKVIPK